MSKWNKVSDMKRLSRMVMPLDAIEGLPDNHVISVTERTIEIDESELVQNNVSTDTYTLELDAEWDGITPIAIFSNSQGDYQVAYENGPTKIPAAVMAVVGSVDVSVFGLDSTGAVRVVTKAAPNTMTVVESGKFVGEVSEDDISLLGQLLAAAEAANEAAANANATIIKSAVATTLESGEPATASIADNVLTIGVPKGEKGDKGDQGDPGQDGTNGTDGVTPFTQATVTTLEPDSPATVAIEEDTLKLGIPKGEKGDKGDTGDQGPQGEPGQDGQDATLPEGMVTTDGSGILSSLGSDGEPSIMTAVGVGNAANGNSAMMSTSSNSPIVSIMNSQTKAGVGFGLFEGEPALSVAKSQSDQKVYGFSPTIPEDDTLTVVTSDAYKADTDPLKQRISELEQQTQNVVTGTSTGLVSHGEDAFPQKPREVRVKGKTWVNRFPVVSADEYQGMTLSTDETGLISFNGTSTGFSRSFNLNGLASNKQYTMSCSMTIPSTFNIYIGNDSGSLYKSSLQGKSSVTFTTGDVQTDNPMLFVVCASGNTVNASFRVMLVDGTEPPDCFTPPASITSVETGNLVTAGKNLLDFSKFNPAYYDASGDGLKIVKADNQPWINIQPMLQLPPGDYTVSFTGATSMQTAIRNIGDTDWSSAISSSNSIHLSAPSEIAVKFFADVDIVVYPQLELGSTATSYEPPNITTTPLPEVELRSLPNGTCDELVIKEDGTCEVERLLKRFDSESQGWFNYDVSNEIAHIGIDTGLGFDTSSWYDVISELPVLKTGVAQDTLLTPHWAYNGDIIFFRFPATEASDLSSALEYMGSIGAYCYAQVQTTTEPQSPVTLPALPAPTFNQYHDSPVPSDTSTEYVRDINLVLANLESVQAALLGGE